MKLLGIGDIHLKARYQHRLDNVKIAFERKFEQIEKYIEELKIDGVICTGDIFDQKDPYKISHQFVNWSANLFMKSKAQWYSIVGNHDFNNTIKDLDKSPIISLFNGPVKRITHNVLGKSDVDIMGFDYGTDFNKIKDLDKYKAVIGVTHCHMSPKPGKFFNERSWGFEEVYRTGCDVILNGHDHSPYEIEKYEDMVIMRPGALFRSRFDQVDINREIQIAYIDTKAKSYNYLPIEVEPAKKIFDMASKENKKDLEAQSSEFFQNLKKGKMKKKSISEELEEMDIEEPVKRCINEYLEEVRK